MRKKTNKLHVALAGLLSGGAIVLAFGGGVVGTVVLLQTPQFRSEGVALSPGDIIGAAAIVYDPTTEKILFAKDALRSLPLASLTKLATAQAALAALPPSTRVVIGLDDLRPEGDSGLRPGDVVSLGDLVSFALVASSNDAAEAAARTLGKNPLAKISLAAAGAGLISADFFNPTGLDQNNSSAGSYGSAYDVAKLTAEFYKKYPQYFELTQRPDISISAGNRTLTASATMAPLQDIPGFVGAKTGYTDLAGGNLAAVFTVDIGHPIVAVVLGSTEEGRFEDIRTMITAVRLQK